MARPDPSTRGRIASWILLLVFVLFWSAMAIGIGRSTVGVASPLALWGLGFLIMVVLLALAGHEINGRWTGILIDTRNKFSLSRLQITLWTFMVLSAYLTMALPRVAAMVGPGASLTQEQALDIKFPEQLILAMGISAASFAGSNLIASNKKSKHLQMDPKATPEAAQSRYDQAQKDFENANQLLLSLVQTEQARKDELVKARSEAAANAGDADKERSVSAAEALYQKAVNDKMAATKERDSKQAALKTAEEELKAISEAQGRLHKNADPSEASWVDLFRGEEIGNYKLVDMSKVQMLFFTVVVITTYAAAVSSVLRNADPQAASLSFPSFSDSLNALLGISHATYLSVKTVDK